MIFKYYDKPELFTGLTNTERICDICRKENFCFDAEAFYGIDRLKLICPDCLVNGKLNEINSFTCNGDKSELKRQIKKLNPKLSDVEIERIVKEKTFELEKTTPHLITWQDWEWPCADGDYCKFIGFGSKPLFRELAINEPAETFFKNSFYDSNYYEDYLWEEVPDNLILNHVESEQYFTLFYVFQSLNSDRIVIIWDCD